MNFRISRSTERLVGALQKGDELVEALTRVCTENGVISGEVRAVGSFDSLELVTFDGASGTYQTVVDAEGSFELVSLTGNIARLGEQTTLRLEAIVNAMGPAGPQLVAGQLRRARAVQAEFVVDSFTDLSMERRLDPETKRLVLDRVERTEPLKVAVSSTVAASTATEAQDSAEPDEEPSMSWDQAVAETERVEKAREASRKGAPLKAKKDKKVNPYEGVDFDEPLLAAGDILDHPKLGRCRVMRVEDDTYAHIRLPRGRIRKLAMEILDISYHGEEEGKRIFQARVRR